MRVTKTVKEYIEKCVREKVYKKYEAEKILADAELKVLNDFWTNLEEELESIAKKRAEKLNEEYDFIEYDELRYASCGLTSCRTGSIIIKDKCYINSKHNWRRRADKEVNEKVTDIIVTLELGGTRADLDRMLSEI